MKKLAILMTSSILFFAACADDAPGNADKNKGEEQIQGPVMNSGTETERQRATDAVRDSSTKIVGDSGAHTLPH